MKTIRSTYDISAIMNSGLRKQSPYVTFFIRDYKKADEAISKMYTSGRVAFIAGKRNGNAVWRNSAKRRMRAVCQELGGPWNGYDVIFLAKKSILEAPYSKVKNSCELALSGL